RKRREVVVQHEALLGLAFKTFDALRVVRRAQRGSHQSLGLAAGEDRGTVRAWQNAHFDPNVTNLVEFAGIGTAALVRNLVTEDALTQRLIIMRKLLSSFFIVFRQLGRQPILNLLDQVVTLKLGMLPGVKRIRKFGFDSRLQLVVISLIKLRRFDL